MRDLESDLTQTLKAAGYPEGERHAKSILADDDKAWSQERKNLAKERRLSLVMLDADSIQDEILASPRPLTANGTSALIRDWDKALQNGAIQDKALKDVTLLYAGGGNAVLLLPQTEPDLNSLCKAFSDKTHATTTPAFIPISPWELVHGPLPMQNASPDLRKKLEKLGIDPVPKDFGACMDALRFAVQHKKLQQDATEAPVTGLRCVECQQRPRGTEAGKRALCDRCHQRREKGIDEKGRKRSDEEDGDIRNFQELLYIDQRARMAYIFLDGKGIGKCISKKKSLREYFDLSKELHKTFAAPDSAEEGAQRTAIPLLEGGDDLMLAVPLAVEGQKDAFAVVADLVERIRKSPAGVDAGVGMVITGSLNADFCMARAKALCNNAKRRGKNGSAIDFEHILEGFPFSDDINALREKDFLLANPPPIPGMTKLLRTQRPYSADDFSDLLKRARKLQDIPRTQLSLLLDAFAPGKDALTAFITLLYQVARGDGQTPSLRDALGLPSSLASLDKLPPHLLRKRDEAAGLWDTGLVDLIEVSGLLARPESGGDEA